MRVERLRANYEIDLKWTHFPLHPSTPESGLTLEQLFAGRMMDIAASKARMEQLMADEGLDYGDRKMTYNSRLAQELAKWVESENGPESVHTALFRAYFVDRLNIGKIGVLTTIAEQLGLSKTEAHEVLLSRRMGSHVDDDWKRSQQLRVSGVPTFRIGDRLAVGAQPYEALEELLVDAGA